MRETFGKFEHDGVAARDPMRSAQQNMRAALPRRFYKTAGTGERDGRYHVLLDGRAIKTPHGNPLALRSAAAAELIASEFGAQGEEIDPASMPCYRLANTAIDGVAADMQAVLEDILRYCGTDLLFYRAERPEGLVARQREEWDPVIDWAEGQAGARFILAEGIVHVAQPRQAIAGIGVHLKMIGDPVVLAAMHSMTTLTGSALLAVAVWKGELDPEKAWTAAHVDEDWNIAQWGEDSEAAARRLARWSEMRAAAGMIEALEGSNTAQAPSC